jgi:hypothetical protein
LESIVNLTRETLRAKIPCSSSLNLRSRFIICPPASGEKVKLSGLNVAKLRSAIERVLTQDAYRDRAIRLQKANQQAGGVVRAADIIERVMSTGKPVVNEQMIR